MPRRRVAVTGLGVVAPCGIGLDEFWKGLQGPATNGETFSVRGFDAEPFFDNPKDARRTDLYTQYAVAAAKMAIEQAGRPDYDPLRCGVWIGTGIGGISTYESQIRALRDQGPRRVSPFMIPMLMNNAAAATVAMAHRFQGPSDSTCTACAAGTHSVANGARLIQDDRCDAVLAGSSEAALTPVCIAAFRNMTALSPQDRSIPFDRNRDGFVMGEGAGVLLLEAWDLAVQRGARILGEILGGASTADAHHITAPLPGGAGAVNCMESALEDAGLPPGEITYVNAHGTSTPLNDQAEAEAVVKVFGTDPAPAVTSIKGVTGHGLGAAGSIEAVSVVLSMLHGQIPPTVGFSEPDPDMPSIDLVHAEPRDWRPAPAISNSFGFGGHNGTLVIGPGEG